MPRIGNPVNHADLPCSRCNSKRKIVKEWDETIKTDHSTMTVHHTKIICTNKECQAAFDKVLKDEENKREKRISAKTESNLKRLELRKTAN